MSTIVVVRPEHPSDHAAIREVNRLAFARDEEVLLVDRLRADGQVIASLVALVNEEIVGHILFSHLDVRAGERGIPAASLAPMAVRPEWQRRGSGLALVRAGLQACREAGK